MIVTKPFNCRGCDTVITLRKGSQCYCDSCRSSCKIEGCFNKSRHKGYCPKHRSRLDTHGDPNIVLVKRYGSDEACVIDGCSNRKQSMDMCHIHYGRLSARKNGNTSPDKLIAEKGAGHLAKSGYREMVINGRKILEHRLVMEKIIGRPLTSNENVHHKNGARADNSPSNLELWNTSQPKGQRIPDKISWAIELFKQYPEYLAEAGYEIKEKKKCEILSISDVLKGHLSMSA